MVPYTSQSEFPVLARSDLLSLVWISHFTFRRILHVAPTAQEWASHVGTRNLKTLLDYWFSQYSLILCALGLALLLALR